MTFDLDGKDLRLQILMIFSRLFLYVGFVLSYIRTSFTTHRFGTNTGHLFLKDAAGAFGITSQVKKSFPLSLA
jgi:hypothetical protein